ncbi:GIY-YIG nuclease family protein [Candidatus Parcubacteria bacterium]|nr:GIY-YIG nuclease family protein [Candidatus Parcubacteria bacterium]MBI4099301.1 GIY-YIG nuclease family protein [Candidatus Parcubacteria bacterium]MBI4385435.1 GIY-YIG nuclease family protein [Candidatus Parcubacteria bacterium]
MPSNKTSPVFFYAYVLQSQRDGNYSVGYTSNLRARVEEHGRGLARATRFRLPLQLIYYEACLNREDAKQRERYLKITAGRRFLAKRLRHWRANIVWHLQ